jgi:hypothetical protein
MYVKNNLIWANGKYNVVVVHLRTQSEKAFIKANKLQTLSCLVGNQEQSYGSEDFKVFVLGIPWSFKVNSKAW